MGAEPILEPARQKKQVLSTTQMLSIASSPSNQEAWLEVPGSCAVHPTAQWGREQVSSSTQLLAEARGEDPSANAQKLMQKS